MYAAAATLCTVPAVSLARQAARALETGRWDGPFARAVASVLGPIAARGLTRPAIVPQEIGLVCVGGATLGGSGKTRVAVACARELASLGARVALVGHAYRAAPGRPRIVSADDALEDVGDEALVCARALASANVPVVIGETRQAAIDRATELSPDVIVLDGPLGIRGPARSRALSLLAVDANRPWGSGRLPPAGDLRAPREVLLAQADHVIPVDATPARVRWPAGPLPIGSLRGARLGLFTALARPDRLVRALAALGVRPAEIVSIRDHGPLAAARSRLSDPAIEAWIATEKCALHLAAVSLGPPLGTLEADLDLAPGVRRALAQTSLVGRECGTRLHGAP